MDKNIAKKYWKENLKYLVILLSVWFTVSFGFGIFSILHGFVPCAKNVTTQKVGKKWSKWELRFS